MKCDFSLLCLLIPAGDKARRRRGRGRGEACSHAEKEEEEPKKILFSRNWRRQFPPSLGSFPPSLLLQTC